MFLSGGCKAADGALTAAKAITRFGANTPAPSIPSGLLMSRVFRPKHRRLPRPTKKTTADQLTNKDFQILRRSIY